jgi:hypothetical protein
VNAEWIDERGIDKPTLLVYGNCQAGAVAAIFGVDVVLAETYNVQYLASFDDRVSGSRNLAPEVIARTSLLLEQFDAKAFPYRGHLPSHCANVVFPSVDLNLLWPLRFGNPLNDPPTEATPWGHYPEGDRLIIDCVQRGLSADETLAHYRSHSHAHLPNLSRYAEMERTRLRAREAKCDIVMSDFIFERLSSDRLFWSANHPTTVSLRELCGRLLAAAGPALPESHLVDLDRSLTMFAAEGPLGFMSVPIHPLIVEHFDLGWYGSGDGKDYGLRVAPVTYDEYFRGMASIAIERLASREAVQSAT